MASGVSEYNQSADRGRRFHLQPLAAASKFAHDGRVFREATDLPNTKQKAPLSRGLFKFITPLEPQAAISGRSQLTLTRLVALLGLVDDVHAALAANELVVTMTLAQALEAVPNFHRRVPVSVPNRSGDAAKPYTCWIGVSPNP